jgi:hypothetical protein
MIFSFGFASRTVPLAMPDRSSAETALNPLAATPVEDLKDRLFWSVSAREEPQCGGEKSVFKRVLGTASDRCRSLGHA